MKKLSVPAALLLALLLLAGCAAPAPAAVPEAPAVTETEAPAAETAVPIPAPEEDPGEAVILDDFSVLCIDGTDFSLSQQLQDHELVLINLWATWCGPCAMEFPYLQEAWSRCADRVAVIALSVEPEDTEEVLRGYAEERGLSFPIGREAGTDLGRFVTEGIPTSILVDRGRRVVALDVGAKVSTQEFLDWFDGFSGDSYDPSVCTYTVCCYRADTGEDLAGVVVNFCTDTTCTPVTSDEDGVAVFTGPPGCYHVQVIGIPEGLQLYGSAEWVSEPYAQTWWLPFLGAEA
ncbi:MAG: redoxin family protein [Oscillospiraceae bacterium]|nr:redoxin family protein [Oscillospiraceae bacterium]